MDEILEKLSKRFEIAVGNFARSCFTMKANEACFQAWFAASVIQEFGLARVYREIHLDKSHLFYELNDDEKKLFHKKLSIGTELFPDVSISYDPDIDVRHTHTRNQEHRYAKDFLEQFAIISEFKVTGSTLNRTAISSIEQDLQKLLLFNMVHMKKNSSKSLATYFIILDNNMSKSANIGYSKEFIEGINRKFESLKRPQCTMKVIYFGTNLDNNIEVSDDFQIITV